MNNPKISKSKITWGFVCILLGIIILFTTNIKWIEYSSGLLVILGWILLGINYYQKEPQVATPQQLDKDSTLFTSSPEVWQGAITIPILLGLGLIAVGGSTFFFFDTMWTNFWGLVFVVTGMVCFYFAYTLKKKYLTP